MTSLCCLKCKRPPETVFQVSDDLLKILTRKI
nr:MAG TPA: hypothetical protein [Caudoviricetes sp.]